MSEISKISNSLRFIKLIMSEDTDDLQENHTNAFLLLIHIAKLARRTPNHPDGLQVGDAIVGEIGTPKKAGLSTKEYRNALEKLEELGYIETVFNPRSKKPQKRSIKTAIKSKIVNLLNSKVCDINAVKQGDQIGELGAIKGRQTRMNKKEKENHHPNPSSKIEPIPDDENIEDDDDFSSKRKESKANEVNHSTGTYPESLTKRQHNIKSQTSLTEVYKGVFLTDSDLEECIKSKGSLDKVKQILHEIQSWKGRQFEIRDWATTIINWNPNNKIKIKAQVTNHEEYGNDLCKFFPNFKKGNGWRCSVYRDNVKDQQGILFENQSPYVQAFFVSFVDLEFKNKCFNFLIENGMIKQEVQI